MWNIIGETIKMYPLFISIFWPCHVACGILVPWQGLNPHSLHWQHSLNCWATREATTVENLITSGHWHGWHKALHFKRLRLSLVWLTSEVETTTALDTANDQTGHVGQSFSYYWLTHSILFWRRECSSPGFRSLKCILFQLQRTFFLKTKRTSIKATLIRKSSHQS